MKFFKHLLKYLGVILVLCGVAILAIAQFSGSLANGHLYIAAALFLIGIIAQIVVNKVVD